MAHIQNLRNLSILYFLFTTFLISSVVSQETPTSTDPSYYYNLCAPSTCSNLSLPYPFTLPTLCHPSPLQTLCPTNQSLLLTSPQSTETFRVLSINFTDPTITTLFIASDALFTCGAQVSRPYYKLETSFFSLPFNYDIGSHLNCTVPIPSNNAIPGLQNATCLGCNGQDPFNVCYYAPGFDVKYPNCETFHLFTPGDSLNPSSVKDLRTYLQSGFQLRFTKPSECRGCEVSGGRCGIQPSSKSFVCFCPNRVHSFNCSDGMVEDLSTWMSRSGKAGSGPSKAVIAAAISASTSLVILIALVDEFPIMTRRWDGDDSFEIDGDEQNRNEEDEKAVKRMCLVGLWCIQHIPSNRPSMDKIVQMLEGHVEIGIPPYPFPHEAAKIYEGTSQDVPA
ncbi:hypothetical protein IFM89_022328 [Coptis chinensis]|uniref:Wall-associated receptor kinase C-terminal domain-containing protein n=1 Tax=Coptis chinensis TaxID=261450 RepID=A0A835LZ64_9MAGN|nr:hypothetical protein IFM89_022328 [Coptis chinensis]